MTKSILDSFDIYKMLIGQSDTFWVVMLQGPIFQDNLVRSSSLVYLWLILGNSEGGRHFRCILLQKAFFKFFPKPSLQIQAALFSIFSHYKQHCFLFSYYCQSSLTLEKHKSWRCPWNLFDYIVLWCLGAMADGQHQYFWLSVVFGNNASLLIHFQKGV